MGKSSEKSNHDCFLFEAQVIFYTLFFGVSVIFIGAKLITEHFEHVQDCIDHERRVELELKAENLLPRPWPGC